MLATKPWKKWRLPAPRSEASTGKLSLVDYEVYTGIEVHDWPFFVRLDGWAFHALTRRLELKKPFDRRLINAIASSTTDFFVHFKPTLCYIFSDEVNFLFLEPSGFRRIEKIDSVFAGLLSASFTEIMGARAAFDCRVIPMGRKNILPYLIWRQAECWRNHNNAWAQWALINKAGLNPRTASERLKGLKAPQLSQLCKRYGIDLHGTPLWQRRGVMLLKETYKKHGYNPIMKKRVTVERHRVKIDWAPLAFDSKKGRAFIESLVRD